MSTKDAYKQGQDLYNSTKADFSDEELRGIATRSALTRGACASERDEMIAAFLEGFSLERSKDNAPAVIINMQAIEKISLFSEEPPTKDLKPIKA